MPRGKPIPKLHVATVTDTYILSDGSSIYQQFDDHGNHRLSTHDGVTLTDWKTYRGIARLQGGTSVVCGTSDYYSGELPAVFEIMVATKRGK